MRPTHHLHGVLEAFPVSSLQSSLINIWRIVPLGLLRPISIRKHDNVVSSYFSARPFIPPTMDKVRTTKNGNSVPVPVVSESDEMGAVHTSH